MVKLIDGIIHIIAMLFLGLSIYGFLYSDKPNNIVLSVIGGHENLTYLYVATVIIILIDLGFRKVFLKNSSEDGLSNT